MNDVKRMNDMQTRLGRGLIAWVPKQDITTWELALCLPALMRMHAFSDNDQAAGLLYSLPKEAKRHFAGLEE